MSTEAGFNLPPLTTQLRECELELKVAEKEFEDSKIRYKEDLKQAKAVHDVVKNWKHTPALEKKHHINKNGKKSKKSFYVLRMGEKDSDALYTKLTQLQQMSSVIAASKTDFLAKGERVVGLLEKSKRIYEQLSAANTAMRDVYNLENAQLRKQISENGA